MSESPVISNHLYSLSTARIFNINLLILELSCVQQSMLRCFRTSFSRPTILRSISSSYTIASLRYYISGGGHRPGCRPLQLQHSRCRPATASGPCLSICSALQLNIFQAEKNFMLIVVCSGSRISISKHDGLVRHQIYSECSAESKKIFRSP